MAARGIDSPQREAGERLQHQFESMLKYSKVIRDPVHGDIWITDLEKEIMDNNWFQRLRRIRQLGPTNLVYPGANHTRFEHSIGTLYVAQQIIDAVNRNYRHVFPDDPTSRFSEYPMTPEDTFVTRIVALIHDTAHLSFGHVLEDEGNLFGEDKQWKDDKRREGVLGRVLPIIRKRMERAGIEKTRIDKTLADIESILVAEEKGENEIRRLDRPYIADICGNTICADLLDYLKRDSYFTGLKAAYDKRMLSYFVLRDYEDEATNEVKPRLAILLERRPGVLRRDVLSDCVGLLRLRYTLAEKVYYHRVKAVLSAMVIKLVFCAMKSALDKVKGKKQRDQVSQEFKDHIMLSGDDAFLYEIANMPEDIDEDLQAAKKVACSILGRQLYTITYYRLGYSPEYWTRVGEYAVPSRRYELECTLESVFEISPGSIIVYATKKDEGKEAEAKMFVRSLSPSVQPLSKLARELEHGNMAFEIELINKRYATLWRFYVLLSPEYADQWSQTLKDVCQKGIEDGDWSGLVDVRAQILEETANIKLCVSEQKEVKSAVQAIKFAREIHGVSFKEFIDNEIRKVFKRRG
ncbi:HD domain-containing protein [candidate division TA06 bacterium]|uniref:HD domain-containing protein n=1 Tax=candidate division TA06 bacterium TaxID=2250710 RepID=A0A523URN4_UNCT6|nr:MAG: HD domain-containing protein [candidate division TA06 bacterium]